MSDKILLEDLAKEKQSEFDNDIVLAKADGRLMELIKYVKSDATVEFYTAKDPAGMMTYRRSATLLMLKAIYSIYPKNSIEKVKVQFSISKGYYCDIYGDIKVDDEFITRVKTRMTELVKQNLPIRKSSYNTFEAVGRFREHKMYDKEKLFKYRRVSKVNIYSLDGFEDYFYGYMVPSTGYIKYFDLFKYNDGFVLQLPVASDPKIVPPFEPQNKLFHVLKDSTKWGDTLGVDTVGALNDVIASGRMNELILVQEALMEKKLGEIAATVASNPSKKFVMIAGPSSSGKTTFSHRLSIQLLACGMKPHPISLDDYFLNREFTPLDENGKYNFECLEALDIKQFNEDMTNLLAGKTVQMPTFNFKTGQREYKGDYLTLGPEDILVLEGIHGLNDKLSYTLPKESKFKIYLSALTQLNIDEHNRIPTTDGRLIRRMVRDARTRGASAQKTISMWDSVRRGEEENIFPFQEDADVMFNSALIYELSVLKQFAEPLLFSIKEDEPEYQEAKRLLKFLDYFLGISSEDIPKNSIVREFVGGSCFKV